MHKERYLKTAQMITKLRTAGRLQQQGRLATALEKQSEAEGVLERASQDARHALHEWERYLSMPRPHPMIMRNLAMANSVKRENMADAARTLEILKTLTKHQEEQLVEARTLEAAATKVCTALNRKKQQADAAREQERLETITSLKWWMA